MKVAIVGAGMGGLAAAIELAARDHEVVVYEIGDRPGGKVGTAERDGLVFDTGPSVLTLTTVLEQLMERAGRQLDEEIDLVQPDPWFRYRYPDGSVLEVAHDLDETLANVERSFGGRAREEMAEFLTYARRIWEAAAPNFIFAPAPSITGVLSLGLSAPGKIWDIDPVSTMWDGITSRVSDERLRWLLARYATYVGADPRRAPATLNCIAWVELGGGAHGIRGGMFALAEMLERVARELGVEFRYETPVASIVETGGRIRRIEAEDGTERVDAVVCNADVGHLVGELMPEADLESWAPAGARAREKWRRALSVGRCGSGRAAGRGRA